MTFFEKSHLFEYFILNYTDCMKRKKISEHVTGNTFIDIHGNRYDISKAKLVEGQIYTAKNERTDKKLFLYEDVKDVPKEVPAKQINAYLMDVQNVFIDSRSKTIEESTNLFCSVVCLMTAVI